MQHLRFFSHKGLLSILCLALLCLTSLVPAVTSAATVVANPLVAVAKDETTSACYIKKATSLASIQSAPRKSCPAGTEIGIKYITLSEALALHESYVLLPPQNAPSSTWKHAFELMDQLMNQKREKLLPIQKKFAVSTNCGTDNYITGFDYRYNSEVEFEVSYHISSTCHSITVINANVTGIYINTVLYWYEAAYANWIRRWGPPDCYPVTNSDRTYWIGTDQAIGYYFLFYMTAYFCLGQNYQFNLGPLN